MSDEYKPLNVAMNQQMQAQSNAINKAEQDAKDAARYRWLRDKCADIDSMVSAWIYDEFDKAIDATMKESAP